MVLFILVVAAVLVLVGAAAWIDLRARRRGARYRIDRNAARDERRKNEADLRMRSNRQNYGGFGGGTF